MTTVYIPATAKITAELTSLITHKSMTFGRNIQLNTSDFECSWVDCDDEIFGAQLLADVNNILQA